jgi:glycosyltransferase involved in cell wall biosynthesis
MFTYSITVVDNDTEQSARSIVESCRVTSRIPIDYHIEPEQNIALARNKAVQNSNGAFLAFIDDDEVPVSTWLISLYAAHKMYGADGVLGPVRPQFDAQPQPWIIKGRICERKSFVTGTILQKHRDTRTGNVLLKRTIFSGQVHPFDPALGRTGGEDVDFFRRMMGKRCVFVWCEEALVYETVPKERMTRLYFLRRALLRGAVSARTTSHLSLSAFKSVIAAILYTAALPIFHLRGHHVFMKYLIKDCDHIGKIFGLCGITLVKDQSFHGS